MINKTSLILSLATAFSLLSSLSPCKADPAKAEDDAYSMAVGYTARGFAMSPTNSSGLGGTGYTVRLIIPVSKGLDYTILVGIDAAVRDVDLYVYDEVGGLILDDRRPDRRAGVKFRSSYSGTVEAYVNIARANGLAAYCVLVGRRGVERSGSPAPQSLPEKPASVPQSSAPVTVPAPGDPVQ